MFIGGRRRLDAAMINRQVAFISQLCRCRCDLPLTVGLHNAARDQRIGPCIHCLMQHIIKLAQLVAAEAKPGEIFSLDPQPRTAQMLR